jgi:hypothetical protein
MNSPGVLGTVTSFNLKHMNILIKASKIQGKGVFAARDFRKGEIVMNWDASVILTKKEAEEIPKRVRKYLVFYK